MIECISETRSRLCKMTTIFTFLQRKNQKIGRMITYPEYWLQKKRKKSSKKIAGCGKFNKHLWDMFTVNCLFFVTIKEKSSTKLSDINSRARFNTFKNQIKSIRFHIRI